MDYAFDYIISVGSVYLGLCFLPRTSQVLTNILLFQPLPSTTGRKASPKARLAGCVFQSVAKVLLIGNY